MDAQKVLLELAFAYEQYPEARNAIEQVMFNCGATRIGFVGEVLECVGRLHKGDECIHGDTVQVERVGWMHDGLLLCAAKVKLAG